MENEKPKKTKQVKTIRACLDNAEAFDAEVNQALADGWYLVRRYTLPSYHGEAHTALVAELQRYVYD